MRRSRADRRGLAGLAGLLAAALAGIALALPAPAAACDGGGGGSSGGGGDGGGGHSADSCQESSEIVGRSECSGFGSWDVSRKPPVQGSVGASFHALPIAGLAFSGVAEHDPSVRFRLVGEDMTDGGGFAIGTLDLRLTRTLTRYLHAGVELQVGSGVVTGARDVAKGSLALETGEVMHISGGAIAGLSVPVTSRFAIGAEAVVGGRYLALEMTSRHADCVTDSSVSVRQWRVAPRLTARRWLSPRLSVNAGVGSELGGGASFGVSITSHGHAWDGAGRR